VPAVLHPEAEGGGGRIGGGRQVGEKANKKHLMRRGIGVELEAIVVRSRAGYRRLPETSRHSCVTF